MLGLVERRWFMGHYDTGMACLNGHAITCVAGSTPHRRERFCSQCGQPAIAQCPGCGEGIRGFYHQDGVIDCAQRWRVPAHCHNCGKPYPWTERRAAAVADLIDELECLDGKEKAKLKKSIPDIVAETPNSDAAVLRFKKAAAKVGQFGGKLLTDVLSNVAAETVKKSMGL